MHVQVVNIVVVELCVENHWRVLQRNKNVDIRNFNKKNEWYPIKNTPLTACKNIAE